MAYLIKEIEENWAEGNARLLLVKLPEGKPDPEPEIWNTQGENYHCSIATVNELMKRCGLDDTNQYTPLDLVGKVLEMELIEFFNINPN